jgi:hypothetical protein
MVATSSSANSSTDRSRKAWRGPGAAPFSLDTKHPASAGLVAAALRAINPDAGRDEHDAAARAAQAKKILGEMFTGEQIPEDAIMPGLGERWGRPKAERLAVQIPKASLTDMTEKIVRGLVYREDGAFIEAPYKIEAYIADDEGAKVCKEMLDKAGQVFKREPGLEIRRASVDGDERAGLYEITFWQQFKTYATVSKSAHSQPDHMDHTDPLDPRRSFQGLILALQRYWADYGCVILQPYDMEVGALDPGGVHWHWPHRYHLSRWGIARRGRCAGRVARDRRRT